MKQIFFFSFLLIFISVSSAGLNVPKKSLKQIKVLQLKQYMAVLTSDSLEGRETGMAGGEKAANYIENNFKSIGLAPGNGDSYRQSFTVYDTYWGESYIQVGDRKLVKGKDFEQFFDIPQDEEIEKTVIYLGAVNDSSEVGLNVKDQVVFIQVESFKKTDTIVKRLRDAGVWAIFCVSSGNSNDFTYLAKRFAKRRKLHSISNNTPEECSREADLLIFDNETVEAFFGKPLGELPVNIDSAIRENITCQVKIKLEKVTVPVQVSNIVGKIEGTNPNGKALVITAHYDHVGRQKDSLICRGADDNGSGSVALMQLARSFKEMKSPPECDIIFVAFTGEERGLWGSQYYMSQTGPDGFLAEINMDMIGRKDTASKDNYIYILGTGKSEWLYNLHQDANNQSVNLTLDYHYDGGSFMRRSDHYYFYKNGVPVIIFFSGLHHDYHTPRDTMDKINFDLFKKRIELIFATAYLIAYDPDSEMNSHRGKDPEQ